MLIFDNVYLKMFENVENVYLFSNPNISAKPMVKYTWHVSQFKLVITELNVEV